MKALLFLLVLFVFTNSFAQNKTLDSLNNSIAKSTSDTQRINRTIGKINYLFNNDLDASLNLCISTLKEAEKINYIKGVANIKVRIAGIYCFKGDYDSAKANLDTAELIYNKIKDSFGLSDMYSIYAMMYSMQNKFDSAIPFYDKAINLAKLSNNQKVLGSALQNEAISYMQQSNFPKALESFQQAMNVHEQIHDEKGLAYIYLNMGITYVNLNESEKGVELFHKAIDLAKKLNLKNVLAYSYANLATSYANLKNYEQEYNYSMEAAKLANQMGDKGIEASSLSRGASALADMGKMDEAEKMCRRAIMIANESKQPLNIFQANSDMGYILQLRKKYVDAIPYLEKSVSLVTEADLYNSDAERAYSNLSICYEKTGNYEKALSNYKIASKIADSIKSKENVKKSTELSLNYEFEKKQQAERAEQQKKDEVTKTKQTAMIIGLAFLLIAAIIAFKGYKNKQHANTLLKSQKKQIEDTLTELKNTQAQLIQSEKMASLGELTAGIAHEIQNPLNFVNNFSEINKELLEELKEEADKGNTAEVKNLATDVIANEEKILHHGKRADAIVKSMLQHSRKSSGQKEPTDINALCDEYLRLSYHGLRAKDKSFNAKFETDFDPSVGRINIVAQDMGRVILNLVNNAFYSVNEKQKQNIQGYEPVVNLSTRLDSGEKEKGKHSVVIQVKDNGNGIPKDIIKKIFQPFYTTKPTGLGTGLGLSLSYDIITKEHGGKIKVESNENEGCIFTINLPIT